MIQQSHHPAATVLALVRFKSRGGHQAKSCGRYPRPCASRSVSPLAARILRSIGNFYTKRIAPTEAAERESITIRHSSCLPHVTLTKISNVGSPARCVRTLLPPPDPDSSLLARPPTMRRRCLCLILQSLVANCNRFNSTNESPVLRILPETSKVSVRRHNHANTALFHCSCRSNPLATALSRR
jgi:hypothetical protein